MTATIEERSFHVLNELFGAAKAGAVIARARKLAPEHREIVLSKFLDDLQTVEPDSSKVIFESSREFAGRIADPVSVPEFMEGSFYLDIKGNKGKVYPAVMEAMVEMNNGQYIEAVLTGGIGTAKTTLSLWSNAYQLYLLSLMLAPQREFDLEHSAEIMFVFQSITATLAKTVDYTRFRALLEDSPYFNKVFPFDKELASELRFPRRVIVKPVSGQETAAIGQNVFGGMIDEVNYMEKIENSTRSRDGGEFDQAIALYNSIARRRESRFMKKGKLYGLLCLSSSTRYPEEFTTQKIREAETNPRIFVYNKRVWDIKPDSFSGDKFSVFIGDDSRKPRILDEYDEVHPKDRHLVDHIPVEYLGAFEKDITNSLREIAGVATIAKTPYIMNVEAMAACFDPRLPSILSRNEVDFERATLTFDPKLFRDPFARRMVHVDLALTGDSVGVCCGYVKDFKTIQRTSGIAEILPNIEIDFALRVTPPPNDEIKFDKIRNLLYLLRENGLNIQWVSFDSFQSRYLMQVLRQQGFSAGEVSVDVDTVPYEFLKGCMYDGRLKMPVNPFLQKELAQLEIDYEKGKIDHPPTGSKDVADALAGCVFGLMIKRIIWAEHNVNPVNIPEQIQTMSKRKGAMNQKQEVETTTRRIIPQSQR